jgi:hypothetical protein
MECGHAHRRRRLRSDAGGKDQYHTRFARRRCGQAPPARRHAPARGNVRTSLLFTMSENMQPCLNGQGRETFFEARDRVDGGARRVRTDDLLLAKQALSQLSYGPVGHQPGAGRQALRSDRTVANPRHRTRMVGLGRFELPTSPLSGVRSNRLSYRPLPSEPLGIPPFETSGPSGPAGPRGQPSWSPHPSFDHASKKEKRGRRSFA